MIRYENRPIPPSWDGKSHHKKIRESGMKFRGVDGEGVTGKDGVHRYVLLGVGDQQIENPDGIGWREAFEFLYSQFKPGIAYCGFFLLYDFTQILKTLPEERARMLWTSEGKARRKHRTANRMPHPVEYQGWQFDLLGTKRLRIRPKTCSCMVPSCKCKHEPWMYVCDVGGFFQTSFINVIDPAKWTHPIVSDNEFAMILEGKKRRKSAVLDADMRRYNVLENLVLERVLETLDTGFLQMQVHLPASKWFGPGQAAQTWMKGRAPERKTIIQNVPEWFIEAARASYIAGWFELFIHGYVPGITHEYDINSAYPDVIAGLPCLLHGKWTQGKGEYDGDTSNLTLIHAKVAAHPGSPIGAMLHRDQHGRISRPYNTAGWYWLDEIQAATDAGIIATCQTDRWVSYKPCSCAPPLREVRDLYKLRLEVGKDTPLGKASKTTYNSEYGKIAQSIGEPMYGNAIYASRITSGCRKKIYQAIGTHPMGVNGVCMVATDAVYFLEKHPTLSLSEELGEWGYTEKNNITLFKPGVYWDDKARDAITAGESPVFKARGISTREFSRHIQDIDSTFKAWGNRPPGILDIYGNPVAWPSVSYIPEFAMTTCLQALRRGKWDTAGSVYTGKPVTQNSNPADKRSELYKDTWNGRTIYRSRPHAYGANAEPEIGLIESEPYKKRFGYDDPWSDESREENGISPDGYVSDEMKEFLYDSIEGIDWDAEYQW